MIRLMLVLLLVGGPAAWDGWQAKNGASCKAEKAMLVAEFPGLTRRQIKDRLRDQNTAAARDIAYVTGLSHASVNAELNRKVGVDRVTMATVEQLQERVGHARRWLDRLRA